MDTYEVHHASENSCSVSNNTNNVRTEMPKSQVSTSLGLSPYKTIATTVFRAPMYNPAPKLHNSIQKKSLYKNVLASIAQQNISVISSQLRYPNNSPSRNQKKKVWVTYS